MDKTQEQCKRCFCARCFLPIDQEDRVDIEGQNFHRICSMCCVCRTIPPSLKIFHGHVFCNDCFKTHVLTRFRSESPLTYSNSWWMQWAPGSNPQEAKESTPEEAEEKPKAANQSQESSKRCICVRCLQALNDADKVEIGGQNFHKHCAKCYICHDVPTTNPKIYYGRVFCEECFHRHVLNRNKDNPSEFFKNCFDQWQNNAQFAETMKDFMSSSKDNTPFVFMMQGTQAPFCRCGTGPQEWFQPNEPKKSATPVSVGDDSLTTWDLSFENRTEVSDMPESCNAIDESANLENLIVAASEKIEKLTQYLHERSITTENPDEKLKKKWKNFNEYDKSSISVMSEVDTCYEWIDLQDKSNFKLDCPKCLWQYGPIYVNGDYLHRQIICEGDNFE